MNRARTAQLFFLDLLYPNCCPCCRQHIPWRQYLCDSCRTILESADRAFCPNCGKPPENCLCGTDLCYDRALVVTTYEGVGRSGILALKTAESLHFAAYCGEVLGDRILQDSVLQSYDLIVPVPMAKRKKRQRSCNPASVLAREIQRVSKIPVRTDLLQDNGTGAAQHTLSAKARAANTAQFFAVKTDLTGYRILLCDDILTTGSTLNRCAHLLKENGAAEVAIAVAATTPLHKA